MSYFISRARYIVELDKAKLVEMGQGTYYVVSYVRGWVCVAFTIIRASLSKMQSRIPISYAKVTASSITLASTSRDPKGACNFLLRATITAP